MANDPSYYINLIEKDPNVIPDLLQTLLKKMDQLESQIEDQQKHISEQDKLIAELNGTIAELTSTQETTVFHLTDENEKLKSELAKYTSPHIPSSKQLYPKKRSGLPRSPIKNKRGGSKKDKSGVTWDQKEPDEVINRYVERCLACGKHADSEDQKISYTKRILELPEEITISLQEHHIHQYECGCGEVTQAAPPTIEGTALGPNFLTFLATTRYHTGASFENISRLIEDIAGIKPSQTMLNRALSQVCESLEPVADEIATEVMNADYIHADETGHKLVQEGKRSQEGSKKIWVWVFATPTAAYYHVDLTRSKKAITTAFTFINENKPPPISVSDAYPAYIGMFPTMQLCWAHFLRDSREVADACAIGSLIHDRLQTMYHDLKTLRNELLEAGRVVTEDEYNAFLATFNNLAKARLCNNVSKIQKYIKKHAERYLTCLRHTAVPPENNHAERLLKTVIVHRSNGKPLRSLAAMTQYGTLLTVLTTWKLRELPVGTTLRNWIGQQIQGDKLIKK